MNQDFALLRLTDGSHVMVDKEELPYLERFFWFRDKSGYVFSRVKVKNGDKVIQQSLSLSRVVNGTPKGFVTDHIDGNLNDYRKKNLRTVTNSQNRINTGKSGNNCSSSLKGVCWYAARSKWTSSITVNYKKLHLGYYSSEVDAAIAYNLAAKEYFGEHARLNDVGKSALSGEGQKAFNRARKAREPDPTVYE